jgi:hypothetical protein
MRSSDLRAGSRARYGRRSKGDYPFLLGPIKPHPMLHWFASGLCQSYFEVVQMLFNSHKNSVCYNLSSVLKPRCLRIILLSNNGQRMSGDVHPGILFRPPRPLHLSLFCRTSTTLHLASEHLQTFSNYLCMFQSRSILNLLLIRM